MARSITLNPATRLEGQGTVQIILDEAGRVSEARLVIPELRGFETFCVGRPAEEMPTLTAKICGICPVAHHLASAEALDRLFGVEPPPAAAKLRELLLLASFYDDHLLHFFFLACPDFVVAADAPRQERSFFGVLKRLGEDLGRAVLEARRRARSICSAVSGSALYPVSAVPGGLSKGLTEAELRDVRDHAEALTRFAERALGVFHAVVRGSPLYRSLASSEELRLRTYSMGMVDAKNRVTLRGGALRVVDPDGRQFARFDPADFRNHLEEAVVPWAYSKVLYLKRLGWTGFREGQESGVYRVGPLGRLNAARGFPTPRAQEEHDRLFDAFGGKPAHHVLAFHWARLAELVYAGERIAELVSDAEIGGEHVRELPRAPLLSGATGALEAPRGTLIHHYEIDGGARLTGVNLLVGTQNNYASISLSLEKAARAAVHEGEVSDALLHRVEAALRAYDPCLSCSTHALGPDGGPGIAIYDAAGRRVR